MKVRSGAGHRNRRHRRHRGLYLLRRVQYHPLQFRDDGGRYWNVDNQRRERIAPANLIYAIKRFRNVTELRRFLD
jgi:hypothetical protein